MAAPNPKPKYIKWVVSESKKIIIAGLEDGILDVDAPSAKNAWDEYYSKLAEFANVPFEQFKKRVGPPAGEPICDMGVWPLPVVLV
jgi:hypothetical protein